MDRQNDPGSHRDAPGAVLACVLVAIALIGLVAANADEEPRDPAASASLQPYRPYASMDQALARSKEVFDERRARYQGLPLIGERPAFAAHQDDGENGAAQTAAGYRAYATAAD